MGAMIMTAAFCLERQWWCSAPSQVNCSICCDCTARCEMGRWVDTCCRCRQQLSVVVGATGLVWSLRRLRIIVSSRWISLLSSADMTSSLTFDCQLVRSDVTSPSCAGLMSHAFRSLLQVSLYRRAGRPDVRVPEASSPYRICLSCDHLPSCTRIRASAGVSVWEWRTC